MTRIRFENTPSANTPINASNLDKLNNVVISPTEPTTGEEVWIQKGKNLFDKNKVNILNGYIHASETSINGTATGRTLYIECKANTTYTISKKASRLNVGYTTEIPQINGNVYNVLNGINDITTQMTYTTGADAKYLVVFYHVSTITSPSEEEVLNSIIIAECIRKIYTKNDNGVYEEFYNENKKVILFEGDTNGDVTLNDNASNYSYMDIHFRTNDGSDAVGHTRVSNPNGKTTPLFFMTGNGSTSFFVLKERSVLINATNISTVEYTELVIGGSGIAHNNVNTIYITKVIGYN